MWDGVRRKMSAVKPVKTRELSRKACQKTYLSSQKPVKVRKLREGSLANLLVYFY
jgi:hypothetical protein